MNVKDPEYDLLKQLTKSYPGVSFAVDRTLRCIYWNKNAEKLTDIKAKDAIGRPVCDLLTNITEIAGVEKLFGEVLKTGKPGSTVNQVLINKKQYIFEIQALPIESGISVFMKDITEGNPQMENLIARQEMLTDFMNSAMDSIYMLDSKLNFIEANEKAMEFLGTNREDLIGKNITEIVPDIISSGRYQKHLEVIKTGIPYIIEDFVPHPVFGYRHFLLKSFKTTNGLGVITCDITRQKQIEASLQSITNQLETLIQVSPLAIVILDLDENVQLWNPAAERIFGWSAHEIMGKPNPIVPQNRKDEYLQLSDRIMQGTPLINEETQRQRKDGSLLDINISSASIFDNQGNVNVK